MAMIACPECTTQISSAAKACPKCGHPLDVAVTPALPAPASAPLAASGASEQTFFQDANPDVLVSSLRIVLGNQTFATQNVSSVGIGNDAVEIAKLKIALIFFGLCSAAFGAGIAYIFDIGVFSGCLIAFGILLFYFASRLKLTYFVLLTGGGGNSKPLSSQNVAYIQKVVTAINQAIMHRH